MARISICRGCWAEENGVKSRIAIPHTCGRELMGMKMLDLIVNDEVNSTVVSFQLKDSYGVDLGIGDWVKLYLSDNGVDKWRTYVGKVEINRGMVWPIFGCNFDICEKLNEKPKEEDFGWKSNVIIERGLFGKGVVNNINDIREGMKVVYFDYILFGQKEEITIGEEIGELCNRNGCKGVITEGPSELDGCSCHISAPCSYCVEDRRMCEDCGWSGEDDKW